MYACSGQGEEFFLMRIGLGDDGNFTHCRRLWRSSSGICRSWCHYYFDTGKDHKSLKDFSHFSQVFLRILVLCYSPANSHLFFGSHPWVFQLVLRHYPVMLHCGVQPSLRWAPLPHWTRRISRPAPWMIPLDSKCKTNYSDKNEVDIEKSKVYIYIWDYIILI